MILIVIYGILGYWAVGRTIYANKVVFGSLIAIFTQKIFLAISLGWILIPIAIIKSLFSGRN